MLHAGTNGIQNITSEFLSMIKLPEEKGKKINYLIVVPKMRIYGFLLGVAYVSAALKASGRSVFTLNLNYKSNPEEELRNSIIHNNINVVMTGGFSIHFAALKEVIDIAKNVKPDIVTVVGGGIITADPVTAMVAFENADYGIMGEGELVANALAHAIENDLDPSTLDGIICIKDGKWSVREQKGSIHDLNILPFPDYEGFEAGLLFENPFISHSYYRHRIFDTGNIAFVNTGRSCPFNCTFCFNSSSGEYRQLSMDSIFKMIDWLISLYPNIDAIWIVDELTISDDSIMEFFRRIKPYNMSLRCYIRANMVTEEMLLAMHENGHVEACLGIESADDRILRSMRKNITVEQVEKVLRFATEIGLFVRGNLIFGDPQETMETFWNSVNWRLAHPDWNIFFNLIRVYPGTQIYKVACEKGIIKDRIKHLKDGCPPVNVSKMTDDEYNVLPILIRILKLENKLQSVKLISKKGYTLSITGICPHCSNEIIYDHIEYLFSMKPQKCPECEKGVTVTAIEYCDFGVMNRNAEALLAQSSGAAVWAVTPYNYFWLFKAMPVLKDDTVKLINKNEVIVNDYAIHTFEGKTIFSPDIINQERIDTVIIPNNPIVFDEIKAQVSADFPHVKRVVHITELL